MHPEWPLILFTFFLCVAGGALGAQGLLNVMGKGKKMQLASLVTALAALVVGGLSVFMHLQHWERIFNGFGHITSGITLEFIFCIVFAVVLVLCFLMMRRSEEGVAPKWVGVVAIVAGLALCAVTGDSYLMSALPVWDTVMLPVYYVVNACFLGSLVGMVIAGAVKCSDAFAITSKVALVAGIVQCVVLVIYAVLINNMGGMFTEVIYYFDPTLPDVGMVDTDAVVGSILTGSNALAYWAGVQLVGVVVPVVLAFLALRANAAGKLVSYGALGLACAVVGAFIWRCLLYMVAVHALPFF